MKKYTAISTIARSDLTDFHNDLIKEIETYQIDDFSVEILYRNRDDFYSAIILQYKEF